MQFMNKFNRFIEKNQLKNGFIMNRTSLLHLRPGFEFFTLEKNKEWYAFMKQKKDIINLNLVK